MSDARPEIKAILDSGEPESGIVAAMLACIGHDRNLMLRQLSCFETQLERCPSDGGAESLRRGIAAIEKRLAVLDAPPLVSAAQGAP